MKISDIFAQNVFNLPKTREYLSEEAYQAVLAAVQLGTPVDAETTRAFAEGLKKWAMEQGVTHFTHWFQPLTGSTAEKHDAFYKPSFDITKTGLEHLSAGELLQREPDASSFPNGGLRGTAAARGYTIWDPSSPPFILETENGKTLYIPSTFVSYTGESLDFKTPLLKSADLLNRAATAVVNLFDDKARAVKATLGWEQEYFLIDSELFRARPDLMLCGRTLFGGKSARGQELADHYFHSIPERVQNFMQDFEREALRLGIPVITRHNEVAPAQYECAPMFEELNVSVDHNILVMDIMRRAALRHGFNILFHEKPFAGINGSGKHNNWSMATDTGVNLLAPGDDPAQNLQFLTFLINVIKGVNDYEALLRASIASHGNDHRLGANEAPPAIISVFTGTLLEQILKHFKRHGLDKPFEYKVEVLKHGNKLIGEVALDNTDRNRTSSFPFTGNKFEFRAVGASASCSPAMTTLNVIIANQLLQFRAEVDKAVEKGKDQRAAIVEILQSYLRRSERIIFNGDGYSQEWEQEAARRGLSNNKTTPEALAVYAQKEVVQLFTRHGIFTEKELDARLQIMYDQYVKNLEIEMDLYAELGNNQIAASALEQIQRLTEVYEGLKEMDLKDEAKDLKAQVSQLYGLVRTVRTESQKMLEAGHKALSIDDLAKRAELFSTEVVPYFRTIRAAVDQLETLVDDSLWRLPKYRELLFVR